MERPLKSISRELINGIIIVVHLANFDCDEKAPKNFRIWKYNIVILVQCSNCLSCKVTNVRLSKTFEDFYILARLIILQSNLNYLDLDYLCFLYFLELNLWCHQFKCINYSHSRIATDRKSVV